MLLGTEASVTPSPSTKRLSIRLPKIVTVPGRAQPQSAIYRIRLSTLVAMGTAIQNDRGTLPG